MREWLSKTMRSLLPPPHWCSGFAWLGWSILGGLLPLWLSALYLFLYAEELSLYEFLKNGEFILYSASFIAGAMYSIRKDIFPWRRFLNFSGCVILAVCVLVYTVIFSDAAKIDHSHPMSHDALSVVSVLVLVVSTLLSLLVMVAEANGAGVDIPDVMKMDGKKLNEKFDSLLAGQQGVGP